MRLFWLFFATSLLVATTAELSGIFHRAELQSINQRFEWRNWLTWTPQSIAKLNLLWDYHQKHEIPREWWAWEYTLSWLMADNHAPAKNKIVIFNHLVEDEPPAEAVESHPWMKPLMQHPVSRKTIAEVITYLAKSGAKLVILDNDFPQYSPDDKVLARAIHDAASGALGGAPTPVFMVSTFNRRSQSNLEQLEFPTSPNGIVQELSKLEPGVDVLTKYSGHTSIIMDEDQVVRRLACRLPSIQGSQRQSVILKGLEAIKQPLPADLPPLVDIDFVVPPNSEQYPVRAFSYLLDPQRQSVMASPPPGYGDVSVQNAIVIIGDGVTDVYTTPLTNQGVNLMSGPEILAQGMDTISRASWFNRSTDIGSMLYLVFCSAIGGGVFTLWKQLKDRNERRREKIADSPSKQFQRLSMIVDLGTDLICFFILIATINVMAICLFAFSHWIVPFVVPIVSLAVAAVACAFFERENQRQETLTVKLLAAEDRLVHEAERHAIELKMQTAEAQAQEVLQDQFRRREFVRRINHDLKAPVTVLNWTLAKLRGEGLHSKNAPEKLERLSKTSDRLFDLISELVQTYDYDANSTVVQTTSPPVDLADIIKDCVEMETSLAEMSNSRIQFDLPEDKLWIKANSVEVARIFDNLIRNAIVHNPPGTVVTVEARARANFNQITISDNGAGIPADKVEQIFDAGFRSENSSGQGLGLNIVKTLVDSLGGGVSVKSEEGLGTTFTVNIPSLRSQSKDMASSLTQHIA